MLPHISTSTMVGHRTIHLHTRHTYAFHLWINVNSFSRHRRCRYMFEYFFVSECECECGNTGTANRGIFCFHHFVKCYLTLIVGYGYGVDERHTFNTHTRRQLNGIEQTERAKKKKNPPNSITNNLHKTTKKRISFKSEEKRTNEK